MIHIVEFLYGVPAILVIVGLLDAEYRHRINRRRIAEKYRKIY